MQTPCRRATGGVTDYRGTGPCWPLPITAPVVAPFTLPFQCGINLPILRIGICVSDTAMGDSFITALIQRQGSTRAAHVCTESQKVWISLVAV